MDFSLTQQIEASPEDVQRALVDPGFLATMAELPRLGAADVLGSERDGDKVHVEVRYKFVAELSGSVTRVVDPDKLTWIEASEHDLDARSASFRIKPDYYANLLSGDYETTITDADGTTERSLRGKIKVKVPLVGGRVERVIVDGLREIAQAQTGLIEAWLQANG